MVPCWGSSMSSALARLVRPLATAGRGAGGGAGGKGRHGQELDGHGRSLRTYRNREKRQWGKLEGGAGFLLLEVQERWGRANMGAGRELFHAMDVLAAKLEGGAPMGASPTAPGKLGRRELAGRGAEGGACCSPWTAERGRKGWAP
jgi:hypothetical protein